jgi:phosphate-selective porin OprO and OprP
MMNRNKLCKLSIFFTLWVGSYTSANANTEALLELLKALHENGTINTETYELVKQVAEQDQRSATENTAKDDIKRVVREEVAEATKDQPHINTREKFSVESKDGDISFRIGGRLQLDAAVYNEDLLRHNDGTEIRRARLFAEGTLWRDWGYKLQYDFTSTGLDGIQDAYIEYNGFNNWGIRFGHFKEPFSLQNMTSSKYLMFMERGLPYLFTPGRNIGVGVNTNGNNWSFSTGAFGEGRDGSSSDNDEGYGFSARATFTPLLGDDYMLHFGGSGSYRSTGSEDPVRFRDRPESHVTDTLLVDTGDIDTDDFSRYATETAMVYGPLSLAGEYYHLSLNRDIAGNPNLDFSGFYVEGGWFLTNDRMNYSATSGTFGKITPAGIVGKGGFGAWQIAVRFSSLDLTDEDILGGEEKNFTVGLNWFATPNLRFIANYINVINIDNGPAAGDEPEIFQIRTQVEF